jgi:hypothetical protein
MSDMGLDNQLRAALAHTEANAPQRDGMEDRLIRTVTSDRARRHELAPRRMLVSTTTSAKRASTA